MEHGESKAGTVENDEPGKEISKAHPSPHREREVAEMPIQTDYSSATRENLAGSSNTTEDRMNPSVVADVDDPSTDSMFNQADPQTRDLLEKNSAKRAQRQKRGAKRRQTA